MTFPSSLSQIIVLVINATGAALVITVITGKLRNLLKVIFAFMTVLMFIWVDLAYAARLVGEADRGLVYIRIAWSVTPMLFVLLYAFIATFLRIVHKHKFYILFSLPVGILFLLIIPFTDLVIADIAYINGTLEIKYGSLVWFFFAQVAFYTIISFILLISQYRNKETSPEIKSRIRYLLAGLTFFFVMNAIFNIGLPVFLQVFHLYEFGDYSLIVFLTIIAYAITTNQFARIQVVTATFLASVLGSFLLLDAVMFSTNYEQTLTKSLILLLYIPFGYLLVNNVKKEIEQREQLEELTNKLKHMDNVKNEFISVAAHELRAPLTAIKGYLSMVIDGDAGSISKQAKEFLQDSLLSNERMIRLVNNMLDVGRIEEGRIIYQEDYVKISELAKIAYAEFKLEAERKNLTLELVIQEGVVDEVFVDRNRLHEVIINFLSNALKYTDEGKVTIKLSNPNKNTVKLEVIDTGPGISQHEQKKLFNKFYRIRSDVGKTIGSGLGLYISKLLIQKFGGNIGVESKPGRGSDFWFELPIKINKSDTGNL